MVGWKFGFLQAGGIQILGGFIRRLRTIYDSEGNFYEVDLTIE